MSHRRRSRAAAPSRIADASPESPTTGDPQTPVSTTNTQLLRATLFAPPEAMLFERIGSGIAWLAFAKVVIVAAAAVAGIRLSSSIAPLNPAFYVAIFLTFAAVGGWLVLGGTRDRGAQFLGGFFLLTALACARGSARAVAGHVSGGAASLLVTDLDPLLPVCLWLFARDFPARLNRGSELMWVRSVLALCTISATVLITTNFIASMGRLVPTTLLVGSSNAYAATTFGLTALAFPYLLFRCLRAAGSDRMRAAWMLLGLVVGLSPLALEVVAEGLVPQFRMWAFGAGVRPVVGTILFGFLLTLPFSTAYAVLTHHTLDVRLVLRRALQCTLTKYACALLCLMPLAYVSWLAYNYRHLTIADLASQPTAHLALVAVFLGVVGLFVYPQMLQQIDQLFFGPNYDERRVRIDFRVAIWKSANATSSTALLVRTVTSLLLAEHASVLLRQSVDGAYRDSSNDHALAAHSRLIDLLARDVRAVVPVTDLLLASVDYQDLEWIALTTPVAFVPMRSSEEMLGVLSVGARRDERPYYAEDWHLLTDLAVYASPILERQLSRSVRRLRRLAANENLAAECPKCGIIVNSQNVAECPTCGITLELSSLPALVNGKYRLHSRIGRGGMGIVYRAQDERLGRTVALKTVPFFSHAGEHRSAAEGRVMAGFLHQNLVTVFAFEVSLGRPVLVLELLEGGTLNDRLARGPLPIAKAVDLALNLCDGLTWLHRQAITHGDVKPSNVGFSISDVPKLLDFGLAQFAEVDAPVSRGQSIRGTVQYRCPFGTMNSSASNDLWGLAAIFFECLTGRRVFDVLTSVQALHHLPDVREFRGEVSPELAAVLSRALSADDAVRPQSAGEFRLWLERAKPV